MTNLTKNMQTKWTDAIAECDTNNEAWVLATIIGTRGSTPRDSGTKMLVTEDTTYDTLGGGRLELLVTERARELLCEGGNQQRLENFALSLKAHQCCGGSVTILFESFANPALNVHIFGAGHVAKALVTILGDLDVKVHWVDARADQFPDSLPSNTVKHLAHDIIEYATHCGHGDYALVLTHDHALDYSIIEQLLMSDVCGFIGLIGSDAKALRFRKHLKHAKFSQQAIDSVHCPVGLPNIAGKKPMQVAVSIAGQLINYQAEHETGAGSSIAWRDLKNNENANAINISDEDLISSEDLL